MECSYCNKEIGDYESAYIFKNIRLHDSCFDKLLKDLNKQKRLNERQTIKTNNEMP